MSTSKLPAAAAAALIVIAILLMSWSMLSAASKADPVTPPRRAPALTVTTASPLRTTWPTTLAASGSIEPWHEAIVATQVGGYQLVDVRANVGDRVRRGQVLARLDSALIRADVAQLLASDEQARINWQRAVSLQGKGAISDQEVLQLATAAKVSGSQLASRRLQLRYTDVVSPDDGVISARAAVLGTVSPAGQELFRLIRRGRLEWRGELTASQLSVVASGQRVDLALPDGSSATATIRDTAPTLDGRSRLGLVYADLEPGSRARAGMYANGHIVVARTAALVIPAESVVIRDGHSYVVLLADLTFTPTVVLRAVTPGRRRGDEIEIVHGLRPTEIVVRGGAGFLGDGDVVRLGSERTQ